MIPCTVCREEAERACSECGQFFCYDHGGPAKFLKVRRMYEFWVGPYWPTLESRYCCNLCRPNQSLQRSVVIAYWAMQMVFVWVVLLLFLRFPK